MYSFLETLVLIYDLCKLEARVSNGIDMGNDNQNKDSGTKGKILEIYTK